MNPIKNVFTTCEGSEKRYSSERKCWLDEKETNGSVGWTKKRQTEVLVGRKRDKAGSLGTRLPLRPPF